MLLRYLGALYDCNSSDVTTETTAENTTAQAETTETAAENQPAQTEDGQDSLFNPLFPKKIYHNLKRNRYGQSHSKFLF